MEMLPSKDKCLYFCVLVRLLLFPDFFWFCFVKLCFSVNVPFEIECCYLLLSGKSGNIPVVEVYGSFVMDLFSVESDLDLSVSFCNSFGSLPRDMKIKTLRKFAKKFFALQSNSCYYAYMSAII